VFGEVVTTEFCTGGAQRAVTQANVAEYVEKYVEHTLVTSIEKSFDPFAEAFHLLITPETLLSFDADEIELLVCGEVAAASGHALCNRLPCSGHANLSLQVIFLSYPR